MAQKIELFKNARTILNSLVELQLKKDAEEAALKAKENIVDEEKVLQDLENFQKMVQADPKMREIFIKLQEKYADGNNENIDPNFILGIQLLDLGVK